MPAGFRNAAGVDFDSVFDLYVQGAPPSNTGFRTSDGVDLAGRYAPIAFGTKAANVGFRTAAGVDVSNLWAAKGTATYVITGLHGKTLIAHDNSVTNQPVVYASVSVVVASNGTWSVSGAKSTGSVAQTAPTSGTWLPSGASAGDYELQFGIASAGHGDHQVSNGAVNYSAMTATRSASLTLPEISANNATNREAVATVDIRLRKISTGQVTTTQIYMDISTAGWQ